MALRIAINGFGRIGRQILQAGLNDPAIEWVAINDLTDTKTLAHLFKYDSVHGISPNKITYDENHLIIDGKTIKVLSEKEPGKLPWKDLNVDIVLECTGLFRDRDNAKQHLTAGAKKVLISAPAKNPDVTIVLGVNENEYDKDKHHIISNASCTTNCLAPLAKVLHDNYTIKRGIMITAHSYTANQNLVDGPHKKDLRRARAAAENIVPTGTGAAKAIGDVMPALNGKLDGYALRVPTPDGSYLVLTVEVEKATDAEKINWLFKQVAKNHLAGILSYTEEPLVSRDIIHHNCSVIFDSEYTKCIDGTLITVSGWYDNEWGYSCRMVDVAKKLL